MKKRVFRLSSLMFLVFVLTLGACESWLFGEKYGPYHYHAVLSITTDIVSVNNRNYVKFNEALYEINDGYFERVSTANTQDADSPLYDVKTDGDKLYLATQRGISVYSSDYTYQETLVNGATISLLLSDNKIYYQKFFTDTEFWGYDINTKEAQKLSEGLFSRTYEVEGRLVYANKEGYLYWADEIDGISQTNGHFQATNCTTNRNDFETLSFLYDGKVGEIIVNNNNVKISYNDEIKEYEIAGEKMLYNRIVVEEDNLLFATMDFVENENCKSDFCICHAGASILFKYNFTNKQILEVATLQSEEYFISYNSSFNSYYSDGKIYRNGIQINEVQKIEPSGEYYQRGPDLKGGTFISNSVFYDDGESLYYFYYDNTKYLKDEYL